jgi:intracellular multiplication protein IcmJ
LHLLRPRIDEEAALIWLPEMSQQALNVLMREIHMQLRTLGECLHDAGRLRCDTSERRPLHYARAILCERAAAAQSRLGTASPGELGSVLLRLSPAAYARRGALLDGVRLLPLGRLHEAGPDIYPQVVDTWLEPANANDTARVSAVSVVGAAISKRARAFGGTGR